MKPNQTPCFIDIYIDGEGKTTNEPIRKQLLAPGATFAEKTNDTSEDIQIDVPNEKLQYPRARNRAARRIIAAHKRKR